MYWRLGELVFRMREPSREGFCDFYPIGTSTAVLLVPELIRKKIPTR
jgi:hypothetical protein